MGPAQSAAVALREVPGDHTHAPLTEPENRRILIVDDNPSLHDDFRKILAPHLPQPPQQAMS